jgi:glycosyltransferase involved in cell wall biosynthesis
MRKKVFLWRNHPSGNLFTYLAVFLSNKVFCTSPYSFTKRFKKTELMPVGIDTKVFNIENLDQKSNSILSLGRISPIKNVEKMVDLAILLDSLRENFVFNIVGDPVNKEDYVYKEMLLKKGEALTKKGVLNFIPAVSQNEAAILYKKHSIFINLTPSGSLDKTILESCACGMIPIVINNSFRDIFDSKMIIKEDFSDISEKVKFWINAPETATKSVRKKLSEYVSKKHSLDYLISILHNSIS